MNCAVCYDWLLGPLERRFLSSCRGRLCGPLSGNIVEIGAGTGLNFAYYGHNCRVLAVEPDAAMRECAERRCRERSLPHIQVHQAWAEEIPLQSASVDHWVSTLVLCSVTDVAAVLREARRVLKPDGQLHLLEHSRGCGGWGVVHDLVTPAWRWLSGGCHLNRRPDDAVLAAGFEWDGWKTVASVLGVPFGMGTARLYQGEAG